mmetsp:Transcript_23501/g.67318  ORF Transcript_23501/g.67318 Transcript_23501/m.67318 type:complete len:151 (-) Transcript_23501:206-658(-)
MPPGASFRPRRPRRTRTRSARATAATWAAAAVLVLSGRHADAAAAALDLRSGVSMGADGDPEAALDSQYLAQALREDLSSLLACALGVLIYHAHMQVPAADGELEEGAAADDIRGVAADDPWDAPWLPSGGAASAPPRAPPKLCIPLLWL